LTVRTDLNSSAAIFLAGLAFDVDQVDRVDAVDFQVLVQVGVEADAFRLQFEQLDQGIAQGVENVVTSLHGPVSSCLFCRDERRKAGHVGEVVAGVLGVGVDLDAVFFLDRQAQFQASTESRPRPSPNSVCSSPISSTLMSSRPRASMISV
jgi:hypothetical protein